MRIGGYLGATTHGNEFIGCSLRYYLWLVDDLHQLLDEWKMGAIGTDALRRQFCLRQVTATFYYVSLHNCDCVVILALSH